MFREKIKDLLLWKGKPNRKPLVLNGARQVGKSWLVNKFGEEYFDGKVITINFEKQKDLHQIFRLNYDIKRILFELELVLNLKFETSKDLVFFDEIQACPEALGSLRYFYEDFPELHLIAAGSLLDFEFRNQPYPVGRVDIMNLHPLTFYEFLIARNKQNLANFLKNPPAELSEAINRFLTEDFNLYLIIGGMPDCVNNFIEYNNLSAVNEIQDNLLYTYEQDFKKYSPEVNGDCLNDILENSARLVGNQIIYSKLSPRFSGPTIKKGVGVLKTARLLHAVPNVSISGLPLSISGKQFKLYHLDIGLLLRKSKLSYESLYLEKQLTAGFKGMLAEQFVAQQIIAARNELSYWARTKPGSSSEVDFVIVEDSKIVPIEVKAGKSGSLKSLHYLLDHNPNIEKAIVYSKSKFGVDGKIHFVPIYFAGVGKTPF